MKGLTTSDHFQLLQGDGEAIPCFFNILLELQLDMSHQIQREWEKLFGLSSTIKCFSGYVVVTQTCENQCGVEKTQITRRLAPDGMREVLK